MSVLTKKEREGLEEVYLSLGQTKNFFQKIKTFFTIWDSSFISSQVQKCSKTPKYGNFMDKFYKKSLFFIKLKKFLSK